MSKLKYIFYAAIALFVAKSFLFDKEPTSASEQVANLNLILDEFIATADSESAPSDTESAAPAQEFANTFATKLNKLPLLEDLEVAVNFQDDGSFLGYVDKDSDNALSSADDKVFKVEVDTERSRLIATDLQHGYVRDGNWKGIGTGLLAGYLVSRMLSGQRRAGISPRKFANARVSPKNYHSSAKSRVASRVASARSSSGSGSFRSGK